MGDDGTFYKGVFLMVFAFGTGIGVGYKVMSKPKYISCAQFINRTPGNEGTGVPDVDGFHGHGLSLICPGKRMADGMAEEEKGEAGGEAARNPERDRTHEN